MRPLVKLSNELQVSKEEKFLYPDHSQNLTACLFLRSTPAKLSGRFITRCKYKISINLWVSYKNDLTADTRLATANLVVHWSAAMSRKCLRYNWPVTYKHCGKSTLVTHTRQIINTAVIVGQLMRLFTLSQDCLHDHGTRPDLSACVMRTVDHPPHVPLVSLTLSAVLKNSTDLSADLFFVLFSLIFLFVSCGRLSYTSAFYCMLNTGYRIVSYHMKVSFLSMIGDSNHTMLYIFVNDRWFKSHDAIHSMSMIGDSNHTMLYIQCQW